MVELGRSLMLEYPRGTVTFFFADIADGGARWERDRPAMSAAFDRYLQILRQAAAAHGGVLFKTVENLAQAAFPTAPAAVAAALEAQRALLAEAWKGGEPLRVQMALHAGEAAPDERGDYLAPALNRLARLLAAGSGGQILLTETAQLLARDALPSGASLRDLGEHGLRDLIDPEHIYQLIHPDLPAEFPPLKTLPARPSNLPTQPTSFLGREHEVREIVELLRAGARLLTLTGPGGTGKTRLAVQAAGELRHDFPDGAFFVPLASISDPGRVLAAIAEALRIREEGSQPLPELLAAFLATRRLLLVLDNVEQVVAAAPEIGKLLERAPQVTMLATSRVPLRLRAEREYAVPPLGLPPRHPLPPPDELAAYEAVRLFVERAQAVRPDFTLDATNAAAIAEICYRLDGLPLAIELAAARVRMLTPQAMLVRLEKRLPLLTGGARDAPQRQRTLRDAIDWSFDLLRAEEQTLFRRLAVFAGGATLEAVEAVANADGVLDVIDGLDRLVEHSLVRQTEGADGVDEAPRFTMLQTIREFGLEQLDAAGETDASRQRLTDYFLASADAAAPKLRGREQLHWLDRLAAEHDNLLAALDWAIAHDSEAALALASGLGWFWHYRGFVSEGRAWLERALALGGGEASPRRSAALLAAAALAEVQADAEASATLATEALAAAERDGDLGAQAQATMLLAFAVRDQGQPQEGQELLERALSLAREAGDRWTEAHCCQNLAGAPWNRGDYDGATALLEEAVAAAEAAGDAWLITRARSILGLLASERGDAERAIALLEAALAQQRVNQDRVGVMMSLLWLGAAHARHGDLAHADELCAQGLAAARELGDDWHIAAGIASLGEVALARGDVARGLACARDSLRMALPEHLAQSWHVRVLAAALVAAGQTEVGVRLFGAEAQARQRVQERIEPADQQRYDETLTIARATLGDERFAAAWAAGEVTPLTPAIEEALAAADRELSGMPMADS